MWQRSVLFGAAFYASAEAGRLLSVQGATYVSYWLPAGLYVAVLLVNTTRSWPALIAAAAVANLAFDLLHGTNLLAAMLFVVSNAVQGVGGAWLVRRYVAERPTLADQREFFGLLGGAAAVGAAAGAVIGAATLLAFGISTDFLDSWKTWWGSNAMAILLVSPLVLTWSKAELRRFAAPWREIEAVALLASIAALDAYLLFGLGGIMAPGKAWLVLPLLWAGLRFGPLGASIASLLAALPLAWLTTRLHVGLTPEQVAAGDYVFVMQGAAAVAAMVALVPAIALAERDRTLARLRELARRVIEVEETERRALSRELHDQVGQNLSALQLNLGVMKTELARGDAQRAAVRLEDARALLDTGARQVRDVMAELRPAALDEFGLYAALRHHAAATATRVGIPVTVEGREPEPRLPAATEIALFRIAQEALNNAAKHAHATKVRIALQPNAKHVTLSITDDGTGFDAARPVQGPSYGIATMRERADAAGATLRIASARGQGTHVLVEAPRP